MKLKRKQLSHQLGILLLPYFICCESCKIKSVPRESWLLFSLPQFLHTKAYYKQLELHLSLSGSYVHSALCYL